MAAELDVDALEWFMKEGGEVSKDTILKLIREIRSYKIWYADMVKNGCGNRECGMAESGFSNYDN